MNPSEGLHGDTSSLEFARWQGAIDHALSEHSRRLDSINGDIKDIKILMHTIERQINQDMTDMKVRFSSDMASLKAKVAMFSAAGGVVGAGVVSFLFMVLAA